MYTYGILFVKRANISVGRFVMETPSRTELEKGRKRDAILKAAEKVFLSKGYAETSMNDLAEKSQFTKRTIYAYFTCKEDLFCAVIEIWYEELFAEMKRLVPETGSGLDRIRQSCFCYYGLYRKKPVALSLMNALAPVKAARSSEKLPNYDKLLEFKNMLIVLITKLFEDGKKDGSIRTDIPTPELVASFVFTLTGYFNILSLNGKSYIAYFGFDEKLFVKNSITLLVDSVKKK